jgi:hypothetical protein
VKGLDVAEAKNIVLAEVDSQDDLDGALKIFSLLGLTAGEHYFYQPITDIRPGMDVNDVLGTRYVLVTTPEEYQRNRQVFEKIDAHEEKTGAFRTETVPPLWKLV